MEAIDKEAMLVYCMQKVSRCKDDQLRCRLRCLLEARVGGRTEVMSNTLSVDDRVVGGRAASISTVLSALDRSWENGTLTVKIQTSSVKPGISDNNIRNSKIRARALRRMDTGCASPDPIRVKFAHGCTDTSTNCSDLPACVRNTVEIRCIHVVITTCFMIRLRS